MKIGTILQIVITALALSFGIWRTSKWISCETQGGLWVRPMIGLDYCMEKK